MENYKIGDKVVKDIRWYEIERGYHLDFEIINAISVSGEEIVSINGNPVEMYRKATDNEIKLYYN